MTDIKSNKIADLYQWFKQGLSEIPSVGESTAVADEVFLQLLGLPKDQRVLKATERISETGIVRLIKAQKRLNNGEPVQYITGVTTFLDHTIRVKPGILIPRPETEGLVLWIVDILRQEKAQHGCRYDVSTRAHVYPVDGKRKTDSILDIGTGSGCIAIALAARLPEYQISACDIDQKILEVAHNNALLNNVLADFFHCDILQSTQAVSGNAYNCIVSNPPYVRQSEKAEMQVQVHTHEPARALFVPDEDPLLYYRAICAFAKNTLRPGGWLFFEINEAMGAECLELLKWHGFHRVERKQDFHGKDRYVAGRLKQKERLC